MGASSKKRDADFIEVCNRYGCAADVARHLGISARSLYKRRRNVEKRTGVTIAFNSDAITQLVETRGLDSNDWKYAWDKSSDDASIFIINPNYGRLGYDAAFKESIAQIKKHAPRYPKVVRPKPLEDGALCTINLADWHFGSWGLERATEAANDVVSAALQRTKGYNVERFLVIVGNDLLHVDNVHHTTTKGTPQVMDGSSWDQAYLAAKDCYVGILERLAPLAKVEVVLCSGNHDELTSFTLAHHLNAHFQHANFEWDISTDPRKYTSWGNSLLAFTHGDKVKPAELPMHVAQEAAELWGATKFRYVYMGHLHHKITHKYLATKEHPGIILDWLSSPKPTDKWHKDRGYISQRGANVYVHLKNSGQDAKFDISF